MRKWPPRLPAAVAHRRAGAVTAAAAAAPTDELVRQHNRSLVALLRRGRIDAARRLFDALPARCVVTWNSFLAALARRRDVRAAHSFFDTMPVRDTVSWNTLLAAYARSSHTDHLTGARRLFDEMPHRDTVTWNTLLSAYTRRGMMYEAEKLFIEMPHRNTASWNTMVTGFFVVGQVKKALDMFEAIPVKDSASLSSLVSGFTRNGWLHEAEEMLTKRLREMDMDKAVDAYNTLIAAYGQAGKVHDARRLFDMMPKAQRHHKGDKRRVLFERNVVSWNSMMMCYIRTGEICSARALFDEMPDKDLVSWNTLIAGYTQVSDMDEAEKLFLEMPDPDPVSWNLMIQGFAQRRKMEHAQGYFDRMPERGTIAWNTMISGYEQNGDYDDAIKLFQRMLEVGERPDRHTLSSVLAACASLAMLNLGVQLHQLLEKSFLPDIATNNALITMYSKCGELANAEAIFYQMTQKDLVSWNALIGSYDHNGHATEALWLFEEMRRAKVMPTHITFISLLSACGNAGLVSEGRMVFDTMVHEYGLTAKVEHYAALVNLVARHGQLEDALKVIKNMPIAPDRAVWGSFLGACSAKNNVTLAQMAANELSKIDPDSSAPYVMIHNLHAREGKWGSASVVREQMEQQGVHKHPGYSWIDMQDKMHVFISGDTSHPLTQEIFSVLECFYRSCRDWN